MHTLQKISRFLTIEWIVCMWLLETFLIPWELFLFYPRAGKWNIPWEDQDLSLQCALLLKGARRSGCPRFIEPGIASPNEIAVTFALLLRCWQRSHIVGWKHTAARKTVQIRIQVRLMFPLIYNQSLRQSDSCHARVTLNHDFVHPFSTFTSFLSITAELFLYVDDHYEECTGFFRWNEGWSAKLVFYLYIYELESLTAHRILHNV